MSRRIDPSNITDEDREYFAQFRGGEEALTSAITEEEIRRQHAAYVAEQKKLREEQDEVNKTEAEKAAEVAKVPASTGVQLGEKPQMPFAAKAIDPTANAAETPATVTAAPTPKADDKKADDKK